jgi:hypothetical protein
MEVRNKFCFNEEVKLLHSMPIKADLDESPNFAQKVITTIRSSELPRVIQGQNVRQMYCHAESENIIRDPPIVHRTVEVTNHKPCAD